MRIYSEKTRQRSRQEVIQKKVLYFPLSDSKTDFSNSLRKGTDPVRGAVNAASMPHDG